jgi:hypothetical protein
VQFSVRGDPVSRPKIDGLHACPFLHKCGTWVHKTRYVFLSNISSRFAQLAPRCFVFRGQKPTTCTDSALPFRSGGGVVCVVRAIMVNIFQRRVYEAPYSTLLKNTTGCSSHTSPRNAQLGVELVAAGNKFTFLLDASSMTRSCLHPFCQSSPPNLDSAHNPGPTSHKAWRPTT